MHPIASDIDFLTARYAAARNKYKPSPLKVLIIAEAPPCNLDRYFFFEEVRTQDSLFLEITGVLYPELKGQYLAAKRDPALKAELLEHFQSDGFWLMDLSELPYEVSGVAHEASLPSLMERLKKVADRQTRIILLKANVYDCCYAPLKEAGYKVSAERIPFPGSGQQAVFRDKFRKALNML